MISDLPYQRGARGKYITKNHCKTLDQKIVCTCRITLGILSAWSPRIFFSDSVQFNGDHSFEGSVSSKNVYALMMSINDDFVSSNESGFSLMDFDISDNLFDQYVSIRFVVFMHKTHFKYGRFTK